MNSAGVVLIAWAAVGAPDPLPSNGRFDYQIGGDYEPAEGERVSVVRRDQDVTRPGSDTYLYDTC